MDGFWQETQGNAAAFWTAAVDPLHKLSWQTGVLFAGIVAAAALLSYWVLRYSWRFARQPTIAGVVIRPAAHTYADHIRVGLADYLAIHGLDPSLKQSAQAVQAKLKADVANYYVITLVETSKRREVFTRELRLNLPNGNRWKPQAKQLQLDETLLTHVRFNNGLEEDDSPDAERIAGTYDVYIRRVRWWDIRHWLTHPNREIRIVIWVTLITTTLPTVIDLLFG